MKKTHEEDEILMLLKYNRQKPLPPNQKATVNRNRTRNLPMAYLAPYPLSHWGPESKGTKIRGQSSGVREAGEPKVKQCEPVLCYAKNRKGGNEVKKN